MMVGSFSIPLFSSLLPHSQFIWAKGRRGGEGTLNESRSSWKLSDICLLSSLLLTFKTQRASVLGGMELEKVKKNVLNFGHSKPWTGFFGKGISIKYWRNIQTSSDRQYVLVCDYCSTAPQPRKDLTLKFALFYLFVSWDRSSSEIMENVN